ncbi:hypothetical protein Pfo_014445 [Paulownia fortunei]|nr:hypothetical protein Pfo_014445 [Paulownia fortunei]
MALETLPEMFSQFKVSYNMNKLNMSLTELMKELQNAENVLKTRGGDALAVTSTGPSSSKPKGKGGNKRKKSNKKGPQQQAKKAKSDGKPKGKCFYCGQKGHWKRNCPEYLASKKQGNGELSFIESCLVVDSTDTWIVDSGATNHICNTLQGFQVTKELNEGEHTLRVGTGAVVSARAVGIVYLYFRDKKHLVLRNCYYVPNITRNLISVALLFRQGYYVHFSSMAVDIFLNKVLICKGCLNNDLYVLKPTDSLLYHTTSNKRIKLSPTNETFLWHLRLGHINLNRIQRLVRDGPLSDLKVEFLPVCESCLEGKMTKRPFTSKGLRAKEVLELVHSDVCGPISVQARGGYEYFITFTDDYSRYGYVYLMARKSEALEKFKEFRNEAEKQLGKNIKTLRSDRGGEYLSNDFRTYLLENGIVSQLSAPGTPQQNGVSERRNRTLLDMARCMLGFSTLSTSFWGYAIQTAVYLLNMVPSKSVPKTPLELWNGRKPNLRHIRVWGCPAHVLKGKMEKMESRSEVCIFVGYPKEQEDITSIVLRTRRYL